MQNIKKPGLTSNWRSNLLYGALILFVIIGFVIYHRHHGQYIAKGSQEAINSSGLQNFLNNKDYMSYQTEQDSFANNYIAAKQYANAKFILDEVVSKVPKDKIISKTYRTYWYLYQQNGDTQNQKKYAALTAEKLKQEGDPTTAAIFEKYANEK